MRNRSHAHHAAAHAVPGGAGQPLRGESLDESNITSLIPVAKAQSDLVAATVWWISRRADSFSPQVPSSASGVWNQEPGVRSQESSCPESGLPIPESCQSNRLDTDSLAAGRPMASPMRLATESGRVLTA